MPYVCERCGYLSQEQIDECPDCGGLLVEEEPKIDWLAEKQEEGEIQVIKKRKNNGS